MLQSNKTRNVGCKDGSPHGSKSCNNIAKQARPRQQGERGTSPALPEDVFRLNKQIRFNTLILMLHKSTTYHPPKKSDLVHNVQSILLFTKS